MWISVGCAVVAVLACVWLWNDTLRGSGARDCGISIASTVSPVTVSEGDVLLAERPWQGTVSVHVGQRLLVVLAADGLGAWTALSYRRISGPPAGQHGRLRLRMRTATSVRRTRRPSGRAAGHGEPSQLHRRLLLPREASVHGAATAMNAHRRGHRLPHGRPPVHEELCYRIATLNRSLRQARCIHQPARPADYFD